MMLWSLEKTFFDQPIKNHLRTNDNIWKIATGQGGDYITGTLLDYPYFKELYKLIAIDISKSQGLDDDPKVMQQIKFTENLNTRRKTISDFFTKNRESTVVLFFFNTIPV